MVGPGCGEKPEDKMATGSEGKELEKAEQQHIDDGETKNLVENCNYFSEFLHNLKERGESGLTNEASKVIRELQTNMLGFLKVSTQLNNDQDKITAIDKPSIERQSANENDDNMGKYNIKGNLKVKTNPLCEKKVKSDEKLKKAFRNLKEDVSTDDSDSSASSENSTDESNSDDQRQSRSKEKRRSATKRSDSVVEILKQFDNRQVPKLEKFNEESGQSLNKYLDRFEHYCEQNLKGSEEFWLSELECHLEGKMLENFKLLRDYDDQYHDLKIKLLRFFKDSSKLRKKRFKKKFENARPKHKESLYSFSIRLESLYKSAYPGKQKDLQTSSKLLNQLKKAISKEARATLSNQILTCKLKGDKPTWKFIQQCIRLKYLDDENSESEEEVDNRREVVINLGRHHEGERNFRPFQNERQFSPPNNRRTYGYNTSQSQYPRFNQSQRPEMRVCHTCKRFGHYAKDCRVSLGLCLLCGRNGHFVKDCPSREQRFSRTNDRNQRYTNDRRSRSFSQNEPRRRNDSVQHNNRGYENYRNNNAFRNRRSSVGGYGDYNNANYQRVNTFNPQQRPRNEDNGNRQNNDQYDNSASWRPSNQTNRVNQASHMNPNAKSYHPRYPVKNSYDRPETDDSTKFTSAAENTEDLN